MIQALNIEDGKNSYAYQDKEIYHQLGFLYFSIAKENHDKKDYWNAYYNYIESSKYFQNHLQLDDKDKPSQIISQMIEDAQIKSKICLFLYHSPRWKPIMHQIPGFFESELLWGDFLYVYDSETITFSKDICKIWIRGIRITDQYDDIKTQEDKSFSSYNLRTRKQQMTKIYFYDKDNKMYDYAENDNAPWNDLVPESLYETIFKYIIKLKSKK